MDWNSILGLIIVFLVIIVLPLALKRRKREGIGSREELYQHLQELWVESSLTERDDEREKIGLGRASGQRSEGIIELKDRNIDSINVIGMASQYGTRYFIDFLVKSPNITGERSLKKTQLVRKKSPPLWGKVVAIDWKGDKSLAQSLNFDYSVEDKLLQVDTNVNNLQGSICILPEPKHGYTRIRTTYFLPSPEIFEIIDIIAKYIKSW